MLAVRVVFLAIPVHFIGTWIEVPVPQIVPHIATFTAMAVFGIIFLEQKQVKKRPFRVGNPYSEKIP